MARFHAILVAAVMTSMLGLAGCIDDPTFELDEPAGTNTTVEGELSRPAPDAAPPPAEKPDDKEKSERPGKKKD